MTDNLRTALAAIAAAIATLDDADRRELEDALSDAVHPWLSSRNEALAVLRYLVQAPIEQPECRYGGRCEPNLANNGKCYKCAKLLREAPVVAREGE